MSEQIKAGSRPLREMNASLRQILRTVARSESISPIQRHELIRQQAIGITEGAFSIYAVDDARLLAASGYCKARIAGHPMPAHVARRSTDLLRVASLRHKPEQTLFRGPVYSIKGWGGLVLRPELLDIVGEAADERVVLGPELNHIIDSEVAQNPEAGCPARGIMLNEFYTSYVDAVYAHQLAEETMQSPLRGESKVLEAVTA